MIRTGLLVAGSMLALAGCTTTPSQPAPIVDGMTPAVTPTPVPVPVPTPVPMVSSAPTHTVQSGETLYRISRQYGVSVADLQSWNQLTDNTIRLGQVLIVGKGAQVVSAPTAAGVQLKPLSDTAPVAAPAAVSTPAPVVVPAAGAPVPVQTYPKAVRQAYSDTAATSVAAAAEGQNVAVQSQPVKPSVGPTPTPTVVPPVVTPVKQSSETRASTQSEPANADVMAGKWIMPAKGNVIRSFSPDTKGIDIAGKLGDPVIASGSGKVVYAGAGLRGYGNMVILKHDDEFLTAYAHASKLLVKEGESIRQGQKIAEMGNSDADQVKLHFEIRRFGKPVDPAGYLKTD